MSRLRRPSPPCCRHTAGRISSVCRTPVRGTPVVSASSCPRVQTGVCLSVLKHTDFHQRSMCVFFCPTIFLMMIYFGIQFVICAVRVLFLPPLFVHAFSTAFVAVCEQSVFLVTCDHSCRSVVSVCKKTKQKRQIPMANFFPPLMLELWQMSCFVFFFWFFVTHRGHRRTRHLHCPGHDKVLHLHCSHTFTKDDKPTGKKANKPALLSASAWSGIHQRALVDVIYNMSIFHFYLVVWT